MNPRLVAQRVLVVGASGQVGHQMLRFLPPGCAIPTSRRPQRSTWLPLDLVSLADDRNVAEDLVRELKVDAVYCLAGMTNVDDCESRPELAMRTNCHGPATLAAAAAKCGARFLYFSSDYVFNGHDGPYAEDTAGSPISVYGRSKWLGELAVKDSHPGPLIIRTTVVYGPDPNGKNFLYSLRRMLSAGHSFSVPSDQMSTPTYNFDLARAAMALDESKAVGIFHVAGPELMSRVEFARRSAIAMGLDHSHISGVLSSELRQPAPRPSKAGLLTPKLSQYLPNLEMRGVESGISHWLADNDI